MAQQPRGVVTQTGETRQKFQAKKLWYVVGFQCSSTTGVVVGKHSSVVLAFTTDSLPLFAAFQGRFKEAEPLFERCVAIREKALGLHHPAVATVLNCQAGLLTAQVRK